MLGLPGHWACWVPAVFTDRDADPDSADLENRAAVAWCEVALLVEHAVVGQEDLVVHGLQLSVVDEGRSVEDVAVLVDEADHCRDSLGGADDKVEVLEVVADESGLQDEVFGRIAGDGQLRKANDVDALVAGASDPVDDQACIAAEVPDGGVDLSQPDSQVPVHITM